MDANELAAKVADANGKSEISLFIVEKGAQGFQIGRKEDKTGARGIASCPLFFDGVVVPAQNRLGAGGANGFKIVMEGFNQSRPIIAGRGIGPAQGRNDLAIESIQGRSAFGQPVGEFQGVRWMLADMAMQTEAARQLVYRAAAMVDAGIGGGEVAPVAAMAKCFATVVAMRVATDAVQLFGAAGISAEYPINRYFRDAKVLQIVEGTNQIQRNIVADALVGRPGRR